MGSCWCLFCDYPHLSCPRKDSPQSWNGKKSDTVDRFPLVDLLDLASVSGLSAYGFQYSLLVVQDCFLIWFLIFFFLSIEVWPNWEIAWWEFYVVSVNVKL